MVFDDRAHLGGRDLAVRSGNGDHLVSGRFDGAAFVHVDVPGIGADGGLMRAQRRGDHHEVGLRAADEEVHGRLRRVAGGADQRGGAFAVRVFSVAGRLLHVGSDEGFEDGEMASLAVIAVETDHIGSSLRGENFVPDPKRAVRQDVSNGSERAAETTF